MEALEEVIAYFTKLALTVLLSKIEKIELQQNTQLEVHPSTMMYRFKKPPIFNYYIDMKTPSYLNS
jgi:hypothetical protein